MYTDRGAQYTGRQFQELLKTNGAIFSMSRKENPYDNALIESFFKTLKNELLNDIEFDTPEQARSAIFKYIELHYNTKGRHSALGYLSPRAFEKSIFN